MQVGSKRFGHGGHISLQEPEMFLYYDNDHHPKFIDKEKAPTTTFNHLSEVTLVRWSRSEALCQTI